MVIVLINKYFMCAQTGVFKEYIAEAGKLAKRDITILSVHVAGQDHPTHIGYKESEYLTCLVLKLD